MASGYAEDLWQSAGHLKPSAYTTENITNGDLQDALLDGTFMVPPLDGQQNYPPQRLKVQTYAIARQAQDPNFMNTARLTSETMTEDVEDQFTNLIKQAIAAFTLLAREADQPLWSRAN